jgi:hypothetical protein
MKNYKQIDFSEFKRGDYRPALVLKMTSKEFAERYSISFSEACDDLGEYDEAFIEINSGKQFVLTQYIAPSLKEVYVHAFIENKLQNIKEFIEALEIKAGDIHWISNEEDNF